MHNLVCKICPPSCTSMKCFGVVVFLFLLSRYLKTDTAFVPFIVSNCFFLGLKKEFKRDLFWFAMITCN